MKCFPLRVLLSFLLCNVAVAGSATARDKAGQFDYYLLNLSWQPEFCHSPRHAGMEECVSGGRGFVVHGLWPQYTKGYPEKCSTERGLANPVQMTDIMPTTWLVQHEWNTHGTCSGLSPEAYFATLRKAYESIRIPFVLRAPKRGFMLSPDSIKKVFVRENPALREEGIAISCGNNYLTAVSVCLGKDLRPAVCGAVRDCRANQVKITPVR